MNAPCLKSIPIWNGPVKTGNAGALARSEREARNSYGVRKLEIERAAHASAGEGARAPSFSLSLAVTLFGQAG